MRIRDWSSDVCSSDLLLALFLLERFGITADYVCREFYSDSDDRETSHAWLEWNGLIIDISGDQFEWPAVIVTRDRGRYELGVGEQCHPFELDPSWWSQQCLRIWSAAQPFLSDRQSEDRKSTRLNSIH